MATPLTNHDDPRIEIHEEIVQVDGSAPVDRRERVEVVREQGIERRERIIEDRGAARDLAIYRVTSLIWLFVGILEIALGLRLALKLIGANPMAPFVSFVYRVTDLFLWPFFGAVPEPAAGAVVLEVSTLIAMFVYFGATFGLIWIAMRLLELSERGTGRRRELYIERHEEL